MRRRTFILLIVVLLVAALATFLYFANRPGSSLANIIPGGNADNGNTAVTDTTNTSTDQAQDLATATPAPTATPSLVSVVVAKIRIPVGELITEDLLTTELRPITNIALRGEYTFTTTNKFADDPSIARVDIPQGQEILEPMVLALGSSFDIGSFGSDLALHIPPGQVAVAFPINPLSGVALAMRPGDTMDILMTLRTIEIDPEFRSALPNELSLVVESALLSGQQFIFGGFQEGRLEFVSQLNQVAVIGPGTSFPFDRPFLLYPIPKRVTQLSIQNTKVLWVGQWQDPRILEQRGSGAQAAAAATAQANNEPNPTPTPLPSRFDETPEIIILSMSSQDALALKWAREQGVDIDLALRNPDDKGTHPTTSVSLSQMIEQGSISIPEPINFDIYNE